MVSTEAGIFALALFDTKMISCDQGYSDFTGWDFEDGLMGSWQATSEKPNYKWNIIQASKSAHGEIKKQYDHTTMTPSGRIAEVTSKGKSQGQGQPIPQGSRSRLRSTKVTNSNGKSSLYCLSFWVWKRSGNDLLEILQEIHQNNNDNVVSNIFLK